MTDCGVRSSSGLKKLDGTPATLKMRDSVPWTPTVEFNPEAPAFDFQARIGIEFARGKERYLVTRLAIEGRLKLLQPVKRIVVRAPTDIKEIFVNVHIDPRNL